MRVPKQVVLSASFGAILTTGGEVITWGFHERGAMGRGRRFDSTLDETNAWLEPIDLGPGRRVRQLTAGTDHVCALLEFGDVLCWGANEFGELGLGHTDDIGDQPHEMGAALETVELPTGRRAVSVASGYQQSCALLDDGSARCWGRTTGLQHPPPIYDDEIGKNPGEMGDALTPIQFGEGTRIDSMHVGWRSACARLDDGTARCWGFRRAFGDPHVLLDRRYAYMDPENPEETLIQHGGDTIGSRCGPQARIELCNGLDDDCDGEVDELWLLEVPCRRGIGVCSDDGVYVCAENERSVVCDAVPDAPASELCNGLDDDCDGDVDEAFPELGTPCAIGAGDCERFGEFVCAADGTSTMCEPADGPGDVERCGTGIDEDCDGLVDEGFEALGRPCSAGFGACRRDGHLACDADRLSLICDAPVPAASGRRCMIDAASIAVDDFATCVRVDGGAVRCWGYAPQHGQGMPIMTPFVSEDMGVGLADLRLGTDSPALEVDGGHGAICARFDDGTVRCWGDGELLARPGGSDAGSADHTMGDGLTPIDFGGAGAVALDVTYGVACAGLDDGTVKCWGRASDVIGDLEWPRGGDQYWGDAEDEVGANWPPLHIGSGRQARDLAVMYSAGCVLRDDDAVVCWGGGPVATDEHVWTGPVYPDPWVTGDNLEPVDFGADRRAVQLARGREHVCALLDDGRVKCWGDNGSGALGVPGAFLIYRTGSMSGDAWPAVDLGPQRAVGVAAGPQLSCAILEDGTARCWGYPRERIEFGSATPPYVGDSPDELGAALSVIDVGARIVAIDIGEQQMCALTEDAEVVCWGPDFYTPGIGDTPFSGVDTPRVDIGGRPAATCLPYVGDLCDGIDDDCDGRIDEDAGPIGDACIVPATDCEGVVLCAVDGAGSACWAGTHDPAVCAGD